MSRPTLLVTLALFALAACTPLSPQQHKVTSTPTTAPTTNRTATAAPSSTASPTRQPYPATCQVTGTGGEPLNIRRGPSLAAEITAGLLPGETVTVTGQTGAWYQITGQHPGFISTQFCR